MPPLKPLLLIADDDGEVASIYARYLNHAGFETLQAKSTAETRVLAEKNKPAIALIDVFMDEANSGFKLCRELAQTDVFLMTSVLTTDEHRIEAYKSGAAHFFIKPKDLDVVVRDARFFLASPQPAFLNKQKGMSKYASSSSPVVIVVDDDPEMSRTVSLVLEQNGFIPYVARNGSEGLMLAHKLRPHAMVVDFLLPDMDGRELLRLLRSHPRLHSTPIVMLTGSERVGLELSCLKNGADDFLIKGRHDLSALPLRISRILSSGKITPAIDPNINVDLASRKIVISGRSVEDLARREFDLLSYLIQRSPAVVPWIDIQRDLWNVSEDALIPRETPTIAVHLSHLTRKLGPEADCLVLHRGLGIQFDPTKTAASRRRSSSLRS